MRPYPKTKNVPPTHTCFTMQCGQLWRVDSSLRSEITQNSLLFIDLLLSLSSLPSVPVRMTEIHFCPSTFCSKSSPNPSQATQAIRGSLIENSGIITFLMFTPVWESGIFKKRTKICGCWEERDTGCVAFCWREVGWDLTKLTVHPLGFQGFWLD